MYKKLENLIEQRKFHQATNLLQNQNNHFSKSELYFYRALICQLQGQLTEAKELYKKALSANAVYLAAAQNIIILYSGTPDAKAVDEVIKIIEPFGGTNAARLRLIAAKSFRNELFLKIDLTSLEKNSRDDLEAYATIKVLKKEFDTACVVFEFLNKNDNLSAGAVCNYAVSLNKCGEHNKAISVIDEALKSSPGYWKLLLNKSTAYIGLKDFENAFKLAVQANDKNTSFDTLVNIARSLQGLEDYSAALTHIDAALELSTSSNALQIKADIFNAQGDNQRAEKIYLEAFKFDNNNRTPLWNLSLMHLAHGNYNEGWELYENGHYSKSGRGDKPFSVYEEWDLNPNTKKLVVWGEQGVGDEIMFLQLVQYLPEEITNITYVTNNRMKIVLEQFWAGNRNLSIETYEAHIKDTQPVNIMVGSLPRVIFKRFRDSRIRAPFLRLLPLKLKKKTTIGFAWRGGVEKTKIKRRSVPLGIFRDVFTEFRNQFEFLPLQYNMTTDEKRYLSHYLGSAITIREYDRSEELAAWVAEISSCDLVISVDNSVVHFASAMGINTHCLLPTSAEWRWGKAGSSTFWYDSLRLHRDVASANYDELKLYIEKLVVQNA